MHYSIYIHIIYVFQQNLERFQELIVSDSTWRLSCMAWRHCLDLDQTITFVSLQGSASLHRWLFILTLEFSLQTQELKVDRIFFLGFNDVLAFILVYLPIIVLFIDWSIWQRIHDFNTSCPQVSLSENGIIVNLVPTDRCTKHFPYCCHRMSCNEIVCVIKVFFNS